MENLLCIGALCVFLLVMAGALWESDAHETVIGHIDVDHTGEKRIDPRTCIHDFESDGCYLRSDRPSRHRGKVCTQCGGVLWENGDITIERGA